MQCEHPDHCLHNAHPQVMQLALNMAGISLSQTGENAIPFAVEVDILNLSRHPGGES